MRSACQGPVAFTISSIVNEPRGPIDSTEEHEQHQQFPILSVTIPCNWIEALSIKVDLIEKFPFVRHVFLFQRGIYGLVYFMWKNWKK